MLYYLLYHTLQHYFSPLNVFRYITVRTVYASLTAMFLALVFGPWLIRNLRELQIGQFIREEGPQAHQKKAGTPTMGGVLIVLSTAVPVLLWADLTNPFILLSLFALFGFAVIGFIDDYSKVSNQISFFRAPLAAGVRALPGGYGHRHCRFLQRGEPDGWAGWAGNRLYGHRGGRAHGFDVREQQLPLGHLSRDSVHSSSRRAHGILRRARRGFARVSLVQRASCLNLHGRRWLVVTGRNTGHHRRHHQAGNSAFFRRRFLRH